MGTVPTQMFFYMILLFEVSYVKVHFIFRWWKYKPTNEILFVGYHICISHILTFYKVTYQKKKETNKQDTLWGRKTFVRPFYENCEYFIIFIKMSKKSTFDDNTFYEIKNEPEVVEGFATRGLKLESLYFSNFSSLKWST